MKKIIALFAVGLSATLSLFGQGQVDFRNSNLTGGPRYVFDVDGVTRLEGPAYLAQLYYSTTGAAGVFNSVAASPVPFRTGTGAGVWNPGASFLRDLAGTTGGQTVHLMVRAWRASDGATYEVASVSPTGVFGSSASYSYVTGGPNPDPTQPAFTAGPMNNFASFSLQAVPEPSTYALGALGVGAVLFMRRRKA